MKTLNTLIIVLFVSFAQITAAQESVENPTAKEDIKVVDDYMDAIKNNKMIKLRAY